MKKFGKGLLKIKMPAEWKESALKQGLKKSVHLNGQNITYTVRQSARAKKVRLTVGIGSGLEVVVPDKFNLKNLEPILKSKESWVLDKLAHFARLAEARRSSYCLNDRQVLFCGREYLVAVIVLPQAICGVQMDEDRFTVTVPAGREEDAGPILECWLRQAARRVILERIALLNGQLKLSYNRVCFKDQKTRWGSCSQKRNLNFNWRLVMAPLPVIDYVVVHELLHLLEPNHSMRFWSLVEGVCPDYRALREWLKKNGAMLTV